MPTTTIYAEKDATVVQNNPTGADPGQAYTDIRVDDVGTKGAPALRFTNMLVRYDTSAIPADAVVSVATDNFWQEHAYHPAGGSSGGSVLLYPLTGAFVENAVTWGTKPGRTAAIGSYGFLYTDVNTGMWKSVAITARVQAWVTTPATNFGLELEVDAVTAGWAPGMYSRVSMRETAADSYLSVTYNRAPGAPAAITSPAIGSVWDATLTVTNTAAVDPEGDALTYEWEYSANGGAAWAALSGYASSLSRVINVAAFAAATTYRVRVRAKDASGSNTPGPWTTLGGNFTIQHNASPTQPTITSVMGAANGGVADLAAGGPLVAPFVDPDVGQAPSAIYIRRKVGAGAWEYYNGGTGLWQAGVVKIAQVVSGYTFPAGKFVNGVTYQLGVSYEDPLGVQSPYSPDFTVTGGVAPTVVVTGPDDPVTDSTFPIVEWSLSDPEGDDQERFQVVVEHDGYGAAPGAGVQDYASGDVLSVTARDHQVGTQLTNGETYRAFVRARANAQWSAWAHTDFTLVLDLPAAPTIVVTPQPLLGRTQVVVTGTHLAAAYPGALAQVQWLDGAEWRNVRGGLVAYDGALTAIIYDVEAPVNRTRMYRAITVAEV